MGYESILVEQTGRVGIITLNRPDFLNAFNDDLNRELRLQIRDFNNDATVGSIVITGAGRAFSAGADVSNFEATARGESRKADGETAAFPKWPVFMKESKPTICAINGYAIGMGITLPLGCDIRLMSESAKLSFRFAYIGLTPEFGSTNLLSQTVGMSKAMEFMLTGRFIEADEALESGLVNHVFPDDQLLDKAVEVAASIAFNPEWQLSQIKRMMIDHQYNDDIDQVMDIESRFFSQSQQTAAHKEFLTSFREKRTPDYHNLS
ncbi:MAG: enoyl-CoA hydratase/isomerase family protein [Dehalococcoidia bacterium]